MANCARTSAIGHPRARALGERLAPQILMMVRTFLDFPSRNVLFALGIAIFVVVALTAFGQIKLNAWNKPFYNALSRKDYVEFSHQLVVFVVIAGVRGPECRPGMAQRDEQVEAARRPLAGPLR
jgi:ABC-type uncharacterized transport system fused permease/ATPase subunit